MARVAVKVCEHCGAVVPPKAVLFRGVKARIYEFIAKHPGCSRDEIMDRVYADDRNGGPVSFNVVNVHISQMRKRLADYSMDIVSTGPGPGATYSLRPKA